VNKIPDFRIFTCPVLTEIVKRTLYQKEPEGPVNYRTHGNPIEPNLAKNCFNAQHECNIRDFWSPKMHPNQLFWGPVRDLAGELTGGKGGKRLAAPAGEPHPSLLALRVSGLNFSGFDI